MVKLGLQFGAGAAAGAGLGGGSGAGAGVGGMVGEDSDGGSNVIDG